MTIKNGDLPAMPVMLTETVSRAVESGKSEFIDRITGLTKREMIAMHVAPTIYNLYCTDGTSAQFPEWRQGVVIDSVRLADLLLDELERTK